MRYKVEPRRAGDARTNRDRTNRATPGFVGKLNFKQAFNSKGTSENSPAF
jgi:hypothetical protein